ncbi:hypothetical protein IMSHALPRED_001401 [Imshaugia aleurites]|uniref:Uncharacterized protein n=1 Tax=Imshaugia aleurites TaxID=172621 RepID=A0A8H3EVW2_9LECA|nr:hypothetical protein IMSHALPRED_001401 [Imshaugia aleurites]
MRLDPDGGTVTMDVGPLSVFTSVSKQDPVPVLPNVQQTSTSLQAPSGTGYVIYPTDYNELSTIPSDGIYVVFNETLQKALFAQYSESCSSDQLSDPACIEGLAEVLYEGAPDLQKRFLPVLPVLAVVVAAEGLVVGILAEIMRNSGQPVSVLHYESSVLVALQDVSTATTASVILVETTTGDSQAISISTTELTSFNPSSTISTAPRYVTSNPNGRLYL